MGVADGCRAWVWLMGAEHGCGWWVQSMGVAGGCRAWVWLVGAEHG